MLRSLIYFLTTPSAWRALITWSKFSLTSHRMLSSLVRQNLQPTTVIDVGANVGQFAVACAKLLPQAYVHSFEPNPDSIRQLRANVSRLPNVRVYPVALGDREGEVVLRINAHSHSSSILPLAESHKTAFPHATEVSRATVGVTTLDRVLHAVPLTSPVLLKLDVQGYEPNVIAGAKETLKRVDYVLMEVSFRPLYEGERTFMEVTRTMESLGFALLRPLDWLSAPNSGEILQMDALYAKTT